MLHKCSSGCTFWQIASLAGSVVMCKTCRISGATCRIHRCINGHSAGSICRQVGCNLIREGTGGLRARYNGMPGKIVELSQQRFLVPAAQLLWSLVSMHGLLSLEEACKPMLSSLPTRGNRTQRIFVGHERSHTSLSLQIAATL